MPSVDTDAGEDSHAIAIAGVRAQVTLSRGRPGGGYPQLLEEPRQLYRATSVAVLHRPAQALLLIQMFFFFYEEEKKSSQVVVSVPVRGGRLLRAVLPSPCAAVRFRKSE